MELPVKATTYLNPSSSFSYLNAQLDQETTRRSPGVLKSDSVAGSRWASRTAAATRCFTLSHPRYPNAQTRFGR
jgi:hypothetical protein